MEISLFSVYPLLIYVMNFPIFVLLLLMYMKPCPFLDYVVFPHLFAVFPNVCEASPNSYVAFHNCKPFVIHVQHFIIYVYSFVINVGFDNYLAFPKQPLLGYE